MQGDVLWVADADHTFDTSILLVGQRDCFDRETLLHIVMESWLPDLGRFSALCRSGFAIGCICGNVIVTFARRNLDK
jgi:hypothetical protein